MTLRRTEGRVAHAMPKDPILIRLLAYWQELRGENRAPLRHDLDPSEMASGLDRIALAEVLADGDFRWPKARRPSLLGRIGPTFMSTVRQGALVIGQTLDEVFDALVAAGRRA